MAVASAYFESVTFLIAHTHQWNLGWLDQLTC